MRPQQCPVLTAILASVMVMYAKDQVIGDARWWNLVMAGILLVMLAHYLWQDRASQR